MTVNVHRTIETYGSEYPEDTIVGIYKLFEQAMHARLPYTMALLIFTSFVFNAEPRSFY